MCHDFLNSPVYVISLKCLSPKNLASKRRKEKNEGGNMCWWNPLEVASTGEEGAFNNAMTFTQMVTHFCVFTSAVRSSNRSEHKSSIFKEQGFTQVPINCVQAAPGTHAELPAMGQVCGGWVAVTVLRAETDQTAIYCLQLSSGSCKPLNRPQSSKIGIWDTICRYNCLVGETSSWCFLLYHPPRFLNQMHRNF